MYFWDLLFGKKKEKAELSASAAIFLNAIHNRRIDQAIEILDQSKKLTAYLKVSNISPFSELSVVLSEEQKTTGAETLFKMLCARGFTPHQEDVSLLAKQRKNIPLLLDLYQSTPALRQSIQEQCWLDKLSVELTRPEQDKEASKLFVQAHQQGIQATESNVELLFSQSYNIPLLQYLFIAQPTLDPATASSKEYIQRCVQAAFRQKNTEGLRLLYSKGALISDKELSVLKIVPTEKEDVLRKRVLRERQIRQK